MLSRWTFHNLERFILRQGEELDQYWREGSDQLGDDSLIKREFPPDGRQR
jgi:hypothetical protein